VPDSTRSNIEEKRQHEYMNSFDWLKTEDSWLKVQRYRYVDCFDLAMFKKMAGCRTLLAQKSAKIHHERDGDSSTWNS
jgi:hypothetical protein